MRDYQERVRQALPKISRYELLTNLIRHPYTNIEAVRNDLGVSRLTGKGFVEKPRPGESNDHVNRSLTQVLDRSRQSVEPIANVPGPVGKGRLQLRQPVVPDLSHWPCIHHQQSETWGSFTLRPMGQIATPKC